MWLLYCMYATLYFLNISLAAIVPGEIGGTCDTSHSSPCTSPHSICFHGLCRCRRFFRNQNGTCTPFSAAALTSSAISAETQHQVKRSFSTYSEYSLRYAQRARANTGLAPGATCSSDANCAGYPLAYCDGVCRCTNEALNAGSTCIKAASQPLEACPSGQTYISEAGACMTGQYPGEPCQYSQQCAAMEPGAFCLQLRCECMYGMIRNGNGCTFVNDECRERGSIFIPELGECRQVLAPGTQGCSHNLQCAQAFPGATCFQQTCTCPSSFPEEVDGSCGKRCDLGNTYSSAAGQCLPTVQAGDRCAYSSQCHAVQPGTICERNVCRCPNGMVSSGSKCVQSCPTGQMVNSKGVCAPGCQRNQIEVNGECLYQSAPGQSCRVNAQCTGGSSCLNDVCTCPRGMLPMGGTCDVARSPPMSSCRNGERCSRDAICVDGSCVCPPGRQIVNGQCIVAITVNIGGGCVRLGAVCLGGSVCVAGICVCPLGTTPYLNRCVEHRLAKPGESCSRHEECSSGTHCNPVTLICECIKSSQMVVGSQCVERLRSHPGLPCSNMEICVGGSSCIQGVCSCPPGTAEANKECVVIRRARPSEDCSRGEECDGGSICDRVRGKCICIDGQRMINDRCVDFVVPLGGFCVPSDRCSGGSYCVDGRCMCVGETYTNGDQCVPRRKILPGSTCQTNDVCTGGSECRENRCTCSNGTVLKGTACVVSRKVSIGEKCTPVDECQGNSSCYMQTCECDAGMVVRENVCQRRQTINPGYLCGADDLCIGNSICIRGVCQCRPGSHIQQSQCVKIESDAVMIGGECTHNQQCMGGSTCTGGVCSCPAGMVVSSQQCKKIMKVPPGSSCAAGEVCDGGSVCDNLLQRCRCSSGLKQSGAHCVPIDRDVSLVSAKEDRSFSPASREPFRAQERLLGPSTSSHSLVQTTPAVVAISMVTNPPLSPISSNMVKNPVDIVSSSKLDLTRPEAFSQAQASTTAKPLPWFKTRRCSASNQCPSGSSCVGGECRCSQGLALSRLGLCVPITYVLPGMACSEGELCRGDAQCRFGICVCPAGQQLSGNECLAATREPPQMHTRPSVETCPQNASCQLPDCFCTPTGTAPPGGFSVANVPQMVVLSFDGPVTDRIMKLYKTLFNGKHRNPNGCAIKGTFFVSHQWNNYDQTQWLHGQGHEIAVNSMTSEPLGNHTKQRWTNEVVGMRDALESFSNVERGSIVGVRAPQLSLGGAAQFAMMKEHGFLYDNSMPVREGPLWPQTLDYALAWDCTGQNCPQQPFPGIWSFPLQLLQANDGIWHNTARAALKPFDSRSTVKQFLRRNFYRNYNTNRAPFVLNADTDFLTYLPDNGVLLAVEDWLNEILQRKDVYVVTAKQAIHWIQRPVGINKLSTFKPWRCDRRGYDHLQPCESPSICSYSPTVASHAHSFRVCGTCPRSYPWLGDPLGKRA